MLDQLAGLDSVEPAEGDRRSRDGLRIVADLVSHVLAEPDRRAVVLAEDVAEAPVRKDRVLRPRQTLTGSASEKDLVALTRRCEELGRQSHAISLRIVSCA